MFLKFDWERKSEKFELFHVWLRGPAEGLVLDSPPLLLTWLTAHLLAGDGNKLILRNGKGPCEGHLQVYHRGEWGYVGDTNWNNSTEKVACRSTSCGDPVSSRGDLRGGGKVWLNELKCNGDESQLWDCKHPGFGQSVSRKDAVMKVRCSRKA